MSHRGEENVLHRREGDALLIASFDLPYTLLTDETLRNRTTARGGEDSELAAAIEASKRSAADDSKRTQTGDADLEEAMRLSREEDERRRRELGSQSDGNLFDEP